MPTAIKEDYLKAMYYLNKESRQINLTDLSKELGVSKPTANNMVKKLGAKGWVNYQKYKPLELTNKGQKAAALIIRKHRLTEMFLQKIMGFGWEEVHEIAEQIEHIQSEKLFERMNEMLNFPSVDPHGSPIPNQQGEILEQSYAALVDFPINTTVQFCALSNSSTELLEYLNQLEIRLGTQIKILNIEPYDQSISITYDAKPPILISHKVGKSLLVKAI